MVGRRSFSIRNHHFFRGYVSFRECKYCNRNPIPPAFAVGRNEGSIHRKFKNGSMFVKTCIRKCTSHIDAMGLISGITTVSDLLMPALSWALSRTLQMLCYKNGMDGPLKANRKHVGNWGQTNTYYRGHKTSLIIYNWWPSYVRCENRIALFFFDPKTNSEFASEKKAPKPKQNISSEATFHFQRLCLFQGV